MRLLLYFKGIDDLETKHTTCLFFVRDVAPLEATVSFC